MADRIWSAIFLCATNSDKQHSLAEVRKHSGRTTFRVRIDQSGRQLVRTLGRAAFATPLWSCHSIADGEGLAYWRATRLCVRPGRSRASAHMYFIQQSQMGNPL